MSRKIAFEVSAVHRMKAGKVLYTNIVDTRSAMEACKEVELTKTCIAVLSVKMITEPMIENKEVTTLREYDEATSNETTNKEDNED